MAERCIKNVYPVCIPKECNVEFCEVAERIGIKKLGNVDGGWASFAQALLDRSKAKKEKSKTKKQREEEAKKNQGE